MLIKLGNDIKKLYIDIEKNSVEQKLVNLDKSLKKYLHQRMLIKNLLKNSTLKKINNLFDLNTPNLLRDL